MNDGPVVIGIDQGTRSSRSIVIDRHGQQLFSYRIAVALDEISAEHIEQDPVELLSSVRQVLERALTFASEGGLKVAAIGLATQRSGVCAWNKNTGEPVSRLISWADTRTRNVIDQLGAGRELIIRKTSLPPLAHYAAGKIALLQSRFSDSEILVGTLDSFLLWQLDSSRPFVTDDTMAARTMLYALEDHDWSTELTDLFNISRQRLPKIRATIDPATGCQYCGIPITALIGDQQAAFLSHSEQRIDCLINFGSIISLLVPTGVHRIESPGFVTSILFSRSEGAQRTFNYLIEGISNAGARVVDYLIEEKKYITDASQINACCARSLDAGSDRQIFLPLGGTGSPDWLDQLAAVESGEKPASADDYVRAAVENIAGFVIRQIEILKERGILPSDPVIAISGGLSQSGYLLDFIAECCQHPLHCAEFREATVAGVARAARAAVTAAEEKTGFASTVAVPGESGARQRYQQWLKLFKKGCRRNE